MNRLVAGAKSLCLFFYDGFSGMTTGRTLWLVVLIKLFVMFAVLKLFFFPDFLGQRCADDNEKAAYVGTSLTDGHAQQPAANYNIH